MNGENHGENPIELQKTNEHVELQLGCFPWISLNFHWWFPLIHPTPNPTKLRQPFPIRLDRIVQLRIPMMVDP